MTSSVRLARTHNHAPAQLGKPLHALWPTTRQQATTSRYRRGSAENVVDKAGFLPSAGPLADFFDNPLVPSGAALFVSATVMLLDFTRPHWQPVTAQAKDWVVRCLSLCAPPPLTCVVPV